MWNTDNSAWHSKHYIKVCYIPFTFISSLSLTFQPILIPSLHYEVFTKNTNDVYVAKSNYFSVIILLKV